ncbi:YiaA/YiaB family inner membrane protein [Herbidospora mongoliensis]|uniref:YiaA/YiaB family inner membrane protein n=1 Tax=Herbidospora mongoliensis TaxID=688067 RepID=UPI0008339B00|nr:YiaA/YiaB family inner membrane protein [Herbidospora mongoliensis]
MSKPVRNKTTSAYFAQSVISFGLALGALTLGVAYLPVDPWIRSFFAVGVFYLVTASFTLAKVIRDRQEETAVVARVDQARLDRLLAEHDPYQN